MTPSEQIKQAISEYHLLKHPFYQKWEAGELKKSTLREYAKQYYHHVKAFPRYVSGALSMTEDSEAQKILFENLADEMGSSGKPHPELWWQFAESLGVEHKDIDEMSVNPSIKKVKETFLDYGKKTEHEGLASLYAYEYQVPEVADTKIEGLKKFYGISSAEGLEFFVVHREADKFHRLACEKIMDFWSEDKTNEAIQAAKQSAKSLWEFLSEMEVYDNAS